MHGYLQFYKMVVKVEEEAYRALQWKAASFASEKSTLALLARGQCAGPDPQGEDYRGADEREGCAA